MPVVTGFVADLRTLLRRPDFRKLFAVRITGQLGDGVLQVALASYVFFSPERQTTAPAAAAAFAVLLLPYSIVGPFAGVLLDRWQRRQVLLVANLLRMVLTFLVAWQISADDVGPVFFTTVLVMLSVNRFVLAGLSASVPRVVPRSELVMANSVTPTAGAVAVIAGVGVGYLTQRLVLGTAAESSTDSSLALAATTVYLVAALLPLRLDRRRLGPDDTVERITVRQAVRQVAAGMVQGAQHIHDRKPALWAMLALSATRFFYGVTLIAAILLSRNYFHEDDVDGGLGTLAMFLGVSGAGFAAAAALTPLVSRRVRKERWAALALALAAVVVVLPGAFFQVPALVVLSFVLGVATQSVKIVVDTVVHERVDDDYRGRVFSFCDVAFNISFVAAAATAAAFLPSTGKSYLMVGVVSAGFALTAFGYLRADRRTVRLDEELSAELDARLDAELDAELSAGLDGGPNAGPDGEPNARLDGVPSTRPDGVPSTRPDGESTVAGLDGESAVARRPGIGQDRLTRTKDEWRSGRER
ncbi:MFS transporter [Phytoactinopolyspora halotolerans]|uniref:MFS transporter n=1 Tax=Phytoactinopolyspora halotolerans TaxID=1981512 RepID=UPI001C205205|nr:MFS transporter [Phytoactinopolyspora halotolerans]